MRKLTFDEAMQRLADERPVNRSEVKASALARRIWVAGAGSPGCLYDSGPYYSATKRDAIETLAFIADDGESGTPRGLVTALRAGYSFSHNGWVYEVSRDTLGGVL
jgi:hypothetical protein